MFRKLLGSNKALSPIFATLIILAVVTVLFIPVFIWVSGISSGTNDSWRIAGVTATERIVVEEVNLKSGQASCTIYVRNIGQTAVSVDGVLVSLADGSGTVHTYDSIAVDHESAIEGVLVTVTISDLGFAPQAGTAYSVKVYTARGVGDSYQVVA